MLPKADPKAAARPAAPRNEYREAFQRGTGPGQSAEEAIARCAELEAGIEALKVRYEHHFLGLVRQPPRREHDLLRTAVLQLRQSFIRNSGARFRVGSLHNRLLTYERLWERTVREMEEGTYHRDLFKARLRRHEKPDEEVREAEARLTRLTEALQPPSAARPAESPGDVPAAPAPPAAAPAPAPRPAPPRAAVSSGGLPDEKVRAIYEAYVSAKKRCKESTQGITYDAVATTLRKQMPALVQKHQGRPIDFKVVIKGGKAVLKAVPR